MKFLRSYYAFSPKMNGFIVEIAVNSYADIFNEYDPSPYRKKDLDPDLTNYINECSTDIPLQYPIALQFNIPKKNIESEEEKRIKDGFQSYFAFLTYLAKKDYRQLILQSIWNIIIATFLLSLAIVLDIFHQSNFIISIFSTCITIGGWVFLWQAITMIVFERKKFKNKYLTNQRFKNCIITFNYE